MTQTDISIIPCRNEQETIVEDAVKVKLEAVEFPSDVDCTKFSTF